jgi:hypothetical protein
MLRNPFNVDGHVLAFNLVDHPIRQAEARRSKPSPLARKRFVSETLDDEQAFRATVPNNVLPKFILLSNLPRRPRELLGDATVF